MPKDNRSISEQISEQLNNQELMERLNVEREQQKLTPSELTPKGDARSENALAMALRTLREAKPQERGEKARRYAVTITELEKVYGYFNTFILADPSLQSDEEIREAKEMKDGTKWE